MPGASNKLGAPAVPVISDQLCFRVKIAPETLCGLISRNMLVTNADSRGGARAGSLLSWLYRAQGPGLQHSMAALLH